MAGPSRRREELYSAMERPSLVRLFPSPPITILIVDCARKMAVRMQGRRCLYADADRDTKQPKLLLVFRATIDNKLAYRGCILILHCDTSNVHGDCCAERRLIITKIARRSPLYLRIIFPYAGTWYVAPLFPRKQRAGPDLSSSPPAPRRSGPLVCAR